MTTAGIFRTVPDKDYFSFFKGNDVDCKSVVEIIRLKTEEVSKATGVPYASVRYDEKMPQEVRERMIEWATLLNLVAQRFRGDLKKSVLWFSISNPLLGDISPRDMIRLGRYKKLFRLVINPVDENAR